MTISFDRASLSITLSSRTHSVGDLAFVSETVNDLVASAAWAVILDRDSEIEEARAARIILQEELDRGKAGARFFPSFDRVLDYPESFPFNQSSVLEQGEIDPESRLNSVKNFELYEPLDRATLSGINSWLRRTLAERNREAYNKVIGFAEVTRLEHHSPLLMEVAIILGAAAALPVLIAYGLLRAAAKAKRLNAEAEIREAEAKDRWEVVKQRKIQTEILEELRDAVKEQRKDGGIKVPDTVLAAAAQIGTPSIADLGSSPLIERLTIGLTASSGKAA